MEQKAEQQKKEQVQKEQEKKEQEKKKDKEAVTASKMLLQSTLLMTAIAMAKDSMGDKKVPQSRQGAWLNTGFKAAPSLLGTKMPISGFNAVMMSLHSDANGFKTNVYTTYENAKKEGVSVMGGQKGLPFNWYQYDSYVNKYNVNDVIDKTVFDQLSPQDKELFKVRQEKTMRSVHNIDQTIMPYESKEAYFSDAEHLNFNGADVFSSSLCDLMKAVEAGEDVSPLFLVGEDEYLASVDGISCVFADTVPSPSGVEVTARALAGSAVDVEYQFCLRDGDSWVEARGWSDDPVAELMPLDGARGPFKVRINTRQRGHKKTERSRELWAMY